MTEIARPEATDRPHRAFVCQTLNPWSYPAKDRSGRLDVIEEAHLGRLIAKIGEPGRSPLERLIFSRPAPVAPAAAAPHPNPNTDPGELP